MLLQAHTSNVHVGGRSAYSMLFDIYNFWVIGRYLGTCCYFLPVVCTFI